tara:strand:- start:792 stop:1316 length:525 start_codon:yes stop_codon:yes gene_type:complete
MRLLKPVLEKRFAGLNLCFGCKDDKLHLLKGCEPVLKVSEIKVHRHVYAHIRELRFNNAHPVDSLMVESGVTNFVVRRSVLPPKTKKCVIVKSGAYPTSPLETKEVKKFQQMASDEGFEPVITDDIEDAGWVIGVESVPLFEAAAQGIKTTLIDTGVGTRLFKMMFPTNPVILR